MTLEEEGVERGSEMNLPTDGAPLKVVVGTSSSHADRPKERGTFTVDEAQTLKRKRGFSHDDMAEVENQWFLDASTHLYEGLSVGWSRICFY